MAFLGLLLIAIGWFLQYRTRALTLDKTFLMLYIGGALLLVIDTLSFDSMSLAVLNVVILLFAILIFRQGQTRRRR